MSHWSTSSGLLSGCRLVKVMVADYIHQVVEGKNPKNTRSMGFTLSWGYVETPIVPPLDDVMLDHGIFHDSLTSCKMLQLSPTIVVESVMAHYSKSAKMNTFILHVTVLVLWRGLFTAESLCKGGHSCDKKDLCLLSRFVFFQPLALSGNLACSPKHTHPFALCATPAKHSANCLSH